MRNTFDALKEIRLPTRIDARLLRAATAVVVTLALCGCAANPATIVRQQPASPSKVSSDASAQPPDSASALSLLAKHSLTASGSPQVGHTTLRMKGLFARAIAAVSADSGLPLDVPLDAPLTTVTYSLRQRTKAGPVEAVFLYLDGRLVGAYLSLDFYRPPFASLGETFAPLR